jgi:hypothetical protein
MSLLGSRKLATSCRGAEIGSGKIGRPTAESGEIMD